MSGPIDLTSYRYAGVERYCDMAAVVFLGYEHILQLGNEYELFWKKRWTFGKALFLWSRYYSLAFNIVNTWAFVTPHPSEQGDHSHACAGAQFFHWQNTGASLQVVTTHLILVLRIYAMYGSTRVMFVACSILVILEALAVGIIFGLPRPGLYAGNNPAPGVFICADGDPKGGHWISYYWTTVICTETILLCLSLYKGWQNRRTGYGGSVMRILTRDSVLYFIAILWVYILNQVLWLVNITALDELGTGLATCISSALANRLMISVRKRYYGQDTMTGTTLRSVRTIGQIKQRRPTETMTGTGRSTTLAEFGAGLSYEDEVHEGYEHEYEYEMQDFQEKRGF